MWGGSLLPSPVLSASASGVTLGIPALGPVPREAAIVGSVCALERTRVFFFFFLIRPILKGVENDKNLSPKMGEFVTRTDTRWEKEL